MLPDIRLNAADEGRDSNPIRHPQATVPARPTGRYGAPAAARGGYNFAPVSTIRPVLDFPPLPAPGNRLHLSPLAGSADALALAHLAGAGRPLAVLTAAPHDAQRLAEEIAWFAPNLRVRLLPDWETLPYDSFSPHHDLVSERLATLYAVSQGDCDVLLVPATTALYRFAPPSYLAAYTFFLKKGEQLKVDKLRAQLALAGYSHVTQVVSPGEFSVRGGLIDLFPMGSVLPYRIDLFDDEVESIRTFDVDNQRSLYPVPEIRLLPAREFPMDDAGRTRFRQRFRETFEGDPAKTAIYKDVSNGVPAAGIEYYLPLFFEETATLFDYLPADSVVCLHRDVLETITTFWKDTGSRYDMLRHDHARPLLPPEQLFLSEEAFFLAARTLARIHIEPPTPHGDPLAVPLPDIMVDRRADDPLSRLKEWIGGYPGRVLICAESAGRRETLTELLREYGLKPEAIADSAAFFSGTARLGLTVAPLQGGFCLPTAAVVTESELFAGTVTARRNRRETARKASSDAWLKDLTELKVGDPVVHEHHGIGRYMGLVRLDLGQGEMEFLELHYANEAKLYVPVSSLHLISRYSGASDIMAPLHRLGTDQWAKEKRKAADHKGKRQL